MLTINVGKFDKMKNLKLIDVLVSFSVFYFQWQIVFTQETSCSDGAKAGPDKPGTFNKNIDKDKATGYLVYSDPYIIKCCGTVRSWAFSIGKGTDIDLQIWRPKDKKNKQYELVGVNSYKIPKKDRKAGGSATYDVSGKDWISVEEDDVIGWYSLGDQVVEYADGSGDGIWQLASSAAAKAGDVVDYSKGKKQSKRTYGIQLTLQPNNPPKLDLLLATSVAMNVDIGFVVYTVHVLDDDPADVKGLKMELMNENEFFAFEPKTGILSVDKEMTVPKEGKKYTFNFKVTDHCGAEDTGSLTVYVDYAEVQTYPPKDSDDPTTQPDELPLTTTTVTNDKGDGDDDKGDGDDDKGDGDNDEGDGDDDKGDGDDDKGDGDDDKGDGDDDEGEADDDKEDGKDKSKKNDIQESTTTSTTFFPEYDDITEPSNSSYTRSQRGSPDIGLIAGIILGCVALLVLVAAAVAVVLSKRAKAKAKVASKDVEKRSREAYAKKKGKPPPVHSVKPSGKTNGEDVKDKNDGKDNEKKTTTDSKNNTSKDKPTQKADDKTTNKSNDQRRQSSDKTTDKKSPQSKPDNKHVTNGKSAKDK